jgi:hypothetical protein
MAYFSEGELFIKYLQIELHNEVFSQTQLTLLQRFLSELCMIEIFVIFECYTKWDVAYKD